jgi:thiamine monophosphate synthase
MFVVKKNYYLYIDNTQAINLNNFKKNDKITVIYRTLIPKFDVKKIRILKKDCHKKGYKFYIANNYKLAVNCKADGLYLSSYNKKLTYQKRINLIGSAHNYKEIYEKYKQGCSTIILSRIFKTHYKHKRSFFGVVKFNLILNKLKFNIVPLGGINNSNLLKLNLISSNGFALMSEVKKKPVITNRLF